MSFTFIITALAASLHWQAGGAPRVIGVSSVDKLATPNLAFARCSAYSAPTLYIASAGHASEEGRWLGEPAGDDQARLAGVARALHLAHPVRQPRVKHGQPVEHGLDCGDLRRGQRRQPEKQREWYVGTESI